MKNLLVMIAFASGLTMASTGFAQSAGEEQFDDSAVQTAITQQDYQNLESGTTDFRGQQGFDRRGDRGQGRGGGWNPGRGGGWNPGRGDGRNEDHSWHFVGCGRRSKCGEMANSAGFPFGYAGIDANACPHDNACYGRY